MKLKSTSLAPWASIAYGIDFDNGESRVVKARRTGRNRLKYEALPFPNNDFAASLSKKIMIAAAMPGEKVISSTICAPFASTKKAKRVFPTLLDIKLPFQLDECIYEFTTLQSTPDSTDALAIATRKCDVANRIAELNQHGIAPHILDHEGLALWTQLLYEHPEISSEHNIQASIHLRKNHAILAVGYKNQFLGHHKVNLDKPQSLERYLKTYSNLIQKELGSIPPGTSWHLSGLVADNNPHDLKLRQYIQDIRHEKLQVITDPEYFLARALATRAILPGHLRINLRSGEFCHNAVLTNQKQIQHKTITTVAATGILLLALSSAWIAYTANQQLQLKHEFAERINSILGYKVKANGSTALLIAKRKLDKLTDQQRQLQMFLQPSMLDAIQQTMAVINSHAIRISQFEFTHNKIRITGTDASISAIRALTKRLESLGYTVSSAPQTQPENSHTKLTFTLSAAREANP